MVFENQKILPALRNINRLEKILSSPFETFVLLDVHISHLSMIRHEAKKHGKKIMIHADLIHGLKTDDYAADFLVHDIKPVGIISIVILPIIIPEIMQKVYDKNNIPIISGELTRNEEHVKLALDAGAQAVTTSNAKLWHLKELSFDFGIYMY